MHSKIIVIAGPTATGKSKFALNLAKNINGELINADSKQIYRYADVGNNKGTVVKQGSIYLLENIPTHLINIKDPGEKYSCFEYQQDAYKVTLSILANNKIPIFVGGSGLYISTIIDDRFLSSSSSKTYNTNDTFKRNTYEKMNIEELHKIISSIDPSLVTKLNESDKKNKRRLIRLIEKFSNKNNSCNNISQSNPFKEFKKVLYYPAIGNDIRKIFLNIAKRIELIIHDWINEVKNLKYMGFSEEQISQCGIGYKEILEYLNTNTGLEDTIHKILIKHRQYAIRQIRWFKKYYLKFKDIILFD
ncbi:MAG: tRNA (adenosine(37)-N6)-dimethylallyltransferase MiaA [Candidatus Dojkabacteria bacterium]|nr:tRNA (adenosine(37)-N6)-dimethylallyltransferase MiaA [Candidatus Dojkabacteria bacterium]